MGRAERGRAAERASADGSPVALSDREARDREAEELARDGSVGVVPGGARRGVLGGSAGLT